MRTIIVIVSLIIMLESCQRKLENKSDGKDVIISNDATKELTYRNPAYMAGSDFLNIFQSLLINQDYQSMLRFTSNESKKKFGENHILDFYKKDLRLGFEIKLKSLKYISDSTTCTLNYESSIYATKQIKTIKCIIENDTAKIYINNLKTIFVRE